MSTHVKEELSLFLLITAVLIFFSVIGGCGSSRKPNEPPATPTGLVATPGDGQAQLVWSAVTGATGYRVYLKAPTDNSYRLIMTVASSSCMVLDLTNEVTYSFAVTAVNKVGESGFSNESGATPNSIPPQISLRHEGGSIPSDSGVVTFSFPSSEIIFTIENSGVGNLFLTGAPAVAINGPDAEDFTIIRQPPDITISPGKTTYFTLAFTPRTRGEKSATVVLTNNDPKNGEYTFAVTGQHAGSTCPGTILHIFRQGSSTYYYNSPTLVDGYIYIGTSRKLNNSPASDNYFFKLDSALNRIWDYLLGEDEVRGGATLDSQGNIYFVVEAGRSSGYVGGVRDFLYSLGPNGNFRWQREITAAGMSHIVGMYNPAVSSGSHERIYVGGGKLYAFDPQGNEVWTYVETGATQMDIKNAPIIDGEGNIYFIGYTKGTIRIYSLDPDGKERWVFDTGQQNDEYYSSPAFSVDGSKIIAPVDQSIYCLVAVTGEKLWKYTPPGISGSFRATPAIDDQDNIYLGTKAFGSSSFYAIKGGGSGLLWQKDMGADLYSSPLLGNDGAVYVGSELTADGKRFHAFDRATGTVSWSIPIQLDITWSSAALSEEGHLYIGSMGGYVYAIQCEASGFLPGAGSPRFHGGNANTGRRE
jgi:outer membrane protein assembly factor BamB